jgi:hypothetical protein
MRRNSGGVLVFFFASELVIAWAAEPGAFAFCRTTTCPLPPDFSPSSTQCVPADFDAYCASLAAPSKALPVWWSSPCVSYDIQQDASTQVPYDMATNDFAVAFSKWTGASCAPGSLGSGKVSIAVVDLGPVECDKVQYNSDQGNQHVIIFHDQSWPYDDPNNTLGLTTITFDEDTGEIYDADMEINSTVPLTVSGPVPSNGYDFMSIITHESGHFFGMAHSGDSAATMFAHYTPGSTAMRNLTADDVDGICSIYAPDGVRQVDPTVAPGGQMQATACDSTPRHGFQSQCTQASSSLPGCSSAGPGARGSRPEVSMGVLAAVVAVGARRRGRRPRYRLGPGT